MSPLNNLELCPASSGSWLITNLNAAIGSPRFQQDGLVEKAPEKSLLVHCRTRRWAVNDPPGPRARVPPALLVPHAARVQCCETAETPCRFGVLGPAADHSTATARQPNGNRSNPTDVLSTPAPKLPRHSFDLVQQIGTPVFRSFLPSPSSFLLFLFFLPLISLFAVYASASRQRPRGPSPSRPRQRSIVHRLIPPVPRRHLMRTRNPVDRQTRQSWCSGRRFRS